MAETKKPQAPKPVPQQQQGSGETQPQQQGSPATTFRDWAAI